MKWKALLSFILIAWLMPWRSLHADIDGELSILASYNKTNLGNQTYTTTRRFSAAGAINVTPVTQIELSFTDTRSFFNYDPVQTTLVHEQVLGLSAVQALVPAEWILQPYVKAGAAQYNRRQSGTVAGIPTTPTEQKSPSAILGCGARIFLLRTLSLKIEGVTYLPNLRIADAKNNFTLEGGVSWHF